MEKIRVLVWNEGVHEKTEPIKSVYPKGIHGAIQEMLGKHEELEIRTATLDSPDHGLTEEALDGATARTTKSPTKKRSGSRTTSWQAWG